MKVILLLLLVAVVLHNSGDVGGQFTAAPPTCPSHVITFNCTVTGNSTGYTIWRVGGGSSCSLSHNTPTSNCGPGSGFTARFINTSATSFSSTLSGPATTALDGTLVECFGPAFSVDAGNRVGESTLQTIGPPSAPALSCFVNTSGAVSVTVNWTLSGGDSADFFFINITTIDPDPPYGGLLNITDASVTQRELTGFQAGYEYNITVRGVNCESHEGNESEPLTITPQVPMAPVPYVRAWYRGTIGTLQTIDITWNETDPVTVSADCPNGQVIRASSYEVVYASSSGTSNIMNTCLVDGTDCIDGVCHHELQNNTADSRCQPPELQFNNESVTATVTAINIVGRSNPATLMTPVPSVCAEYDRITGTLQRIESTWNGMDSYELSYTNMSGTSITTCAVNGTDCSDGVCRHELQSNTTNSRCQPAKPQFDRIIVVLTMTTTNIDYSVSRIINSSNTLTVNVDSTNIANTFVDCTFEPGYSCTIDYGTDSTYTNLVHRDNSSTMEGETTINLSENLQENITYYYIVSAVSTSQCERVRGRFRSDCTGTDLGITATQGGMVDPACTDRGFGNSLPIPDGVVCYNETTALSKAVYHCNANSFMRGGATRVCQRNGFWSGSTPQCVAVGVVVGPVVGFVGLVGGVVFVVVPNIGAVIIIILITVKNFRNTKGLYYWMVVILFLSLIGIPLAIAIAVWFCRKTDKDGTTSGACCTLDEAGETPHGTGVTCCVIVAIVLSHLFVIWIPLEIMIAVWFFKKPDESGTTGGARHIPDGAGVNRYIIFTIVVLCLSVIGIPSAIMIGVWFFKKTDKAVTCCEIVMIVLLCLSVVGIPLAIMIAVCFRKTDKGGTTGGARHTPDGAGVNRYIIFTIVVLCLSVIGSPLALMIAMWFFRKTDKDVTGFVIVTIFVLYLSVIGFPLAIMIAVWFFKKTDQGLIIAIVVLLCLSVIGIPLAIPIAVLSFKKTDKSSTEDTD